MSTPIFLVAEFLSNAILRFSVEGSRELSIVVAGSYSILFFSPFSSNLLRVIYVLGSENGDYHRSAGVLHLLWSKRELERSRFPYLCEL